MVKGGGNEKGHRKEGKFPPREKYRKGHHATKTLEKKRVNVKKHQLVITNYRLGGVETGDITRSGRGGADYSSPSHLVQHEKAKGQ